MQVNRLRFNFSGTRVLVIWYHDLDYAKFAYCEHASRDRVLVEVLQLDR